MEVTTFTCLFAIKRAQCIPARAPPSGAIPRPMIAKILHFHNRENILRAARNGPELEFNGYSISIYPDFSVATHKQWASSASEEVSQRSGYGIEHALPG